MDAGITLTLQYPTGLSSSIKTSSAAKNVSRRNWSMTKCLSFGVTACLSSPIYQISVDTFPKELAWGSLSRRPTQPPCHWDDWASSHCSFPWPKCRSAAHLAFAAQCIIKAMVYFCRERAKKKNPTSGHISSQLESHTHFTILCLKPIDLNHCMISFFYRQLTYLNGTPGVLSASNIDGFALILYSNTQKLGKPVHP